MTGSVMRRDPNTPIQPSSKAILMAMGRQAAKPNVNHQRLKESILFIGASCQR